MLKAHQQECLFYILTDTENISRYFRDWLLVETRGYTYVWPIDDVKRAFGPYLSDLLMNEMLKGDLFKFDRRRSNRN